MFEQRNQFDNRCLAESGWLGLPEVIGDDAIKPSHVPTAADIQVLHDSWWQEVGALDQVPIHIDTIERTVRTVSHLHWPEPDVAGGEELCVPVGALSDHADPVRLEARTVD